MPRYVALLRGINLGPRNRVPMAELRAALEELGYEDVRTLLQSGNVGVTSSRSAKAVREELMEERKAQLAEMEEGWSERSFNFCEH